VLSYVVITPARNEEEYIGLTIESMIAQTIKPLCWVIVSDGSTDRTDSIVSEYARTHNWIRLLRLGGRRDRNFAAKVRSFAAGRQELGDLSFDVIASLDADISFGPDYFEFLLSKCAENLRLGVVGTPFVEKGRHYDYRFTNIEHVSGACQVFRRECFDAIGGYVPIKGGGIDWTAVTTARMMGWQTRTFGERTCQHHRPMGTGSARQLQATFRHGKKDYLLGGHPLWQVFRSAYQCSRPPYIVGGLLLMAGYGWAAACQAERPVSPELMRFHRMEQLNRLRSAIGRPLRRRTNA